MAQKEMTFWLWRLTLSRRNLPLQVIGFVAFCFASFFFFTRLGAQNNQLAVLLPLFLNPFFIISVLILVASQIDLDYMEYKIERQHVDAPPVPLIRRHKIIPQRYRTIFGNDRFMNLWRWRFTYIAFAALALAHWFSTIK